MSKKDNEIQHIEKRPSPGVGRGDPPGNFLPEKIFSQRRMIGRLWYGLGYVAGFAGGLSMLLSIGLLVSLVVAGAWLFSRPLLLLQLRRQGALKRRRPESEI